MTPRDLENEVATPKLYKVIDATLMLLIYEFGKPRRDGFLKSVCKLKFQRL